MIASLALNIIALEHHIQCLASPVIAMISDTLSQENHSVFLNNSLRSLMKSSFRIFIKFRFARTKYMNSDHQSLLTNFPTFTRLEKLEYASAFKVEVAWFPFQSCDNVFPEILNNWEFSCYAASQTNENSGKFDANQKIWKIMPGYGSYKAPETEEAPIDWGSVNAEYEAAQKVTFKFNFFLKNAFSIYIPIWSQTMLASLLFFLNFTIAPRFARVKSKE